MKVFPLQCRSSPRWLLALELRLTAQQQLPDNQLAQNTQAQGSTMRRRLKQGPPVKAGMLRNQAGFIAGKASALSSAQATAGPRWLLARAGASQAYTMFGSASRGIEGYNEKLSNYARERTLADNAAKVDARLSKQIPILKLGANKNGRRGLSAVPVLGPPADLFAKGYRVSCRQLQMEARCAAVNVASTWLRRRTSRILNSANQNATQYASDVNQANRETGDRMASISIQQGKESAGAAYAAAGLPSLDKGRRKASTIKLRELSSLEESPAPKSIRKRRSIPRSFKRFQRSSVAWERSLRRILRRAWRCGTEARVLSR